MSLYYKHTKLIFQRNVYKPTVEDKRSITELRTQGTKTNSFTPLVKSRQLLLFSQSRADNSCIFSQSRADNSYFFLPSCCCPWHPPQTECDPRRKFPGGSSPHPRGWGAGCWWRFHYCSWCPSGKTRERQEFTGYMSRSLPLKANIFKGHSSVKEG